MENLEKSTEVSNSIKIEEFTEELKLLIEECFEGKASIKPNNIINLAFFCGENFEIAVTKK